MSPPWNFKRPPIDKSWIKSARQANSSPGLLTTLKKLLLVLGYCILRRTKRESLTGRAASTIVTYSINESALHNNPYMDIIQKKYAAAGAPVNQIVIPQFDDRNISYPDSVHSIGGYGDPKMLSGQLRQLFIDVLLGRIAIHGIPQTIENIVAFNVAVTVYRELTRLQQGGKVFLPLEGNLWEYHLHQMDKVSGLSVYCYLNTFIFPGSYSMEKIVKMGFADVFLDCGSQLARIVPTDNVVKIGTTKSKVIESDKSGPKAVLLLPEGTRAESERFLKAAIYLNTYIDRKVTRIRFHPLVNTKIWGKKLIEKANSQGVLDCSESLQQAISKSKEIVYCSSTSILESLNSELCIPVYFGDEKVARADQDPLFSMLSPPACAENIHLLGELLSSETVSNGPQANKIYESVIYENVP